MGVRIWRHVLTAVIACGALVSPSSVDAQSRVRVQNAYEQGYHEGVHHGERDGRAGLTFNPGHDLVLRTRGASAEVFRRGYQEGYRAGYGRYYAAGQRNRPGGVRENRGLVLRGPRGVVDAVAVGYDRGFEKGIEDGRDGDRYDPVRHRDYRDGDEGYSNGDGSRDAYRDNYRAGFRQGYEEGYRQGTRNRRR